MFRRALLLVLIVGIAACGTNSTSEPQSAATSVVAPPAAPRAPAPEPTWQTIATWSGSGMKETETFTTRTREWRIQWQSRREPFPNAGLLQIFVHDADGGVVSLAANKQGPGKDVSYVRAPAGPHYLMINSANIDWTVTVEERR
jgi:hypothetical protein